jgi:tetratricopeptide (TPR) repeat protein
LKLGLPLEYLPHGPRTMEARRLAWQGSVLRDLGEPSAARPLYERSLQITTAINYESGRAHALNCLGTLAQRRGELDEATRFYFAALRDALHSGEPRLVGMVEQNLGIVAGIRGNPASALAHYRVSLRTFEKSNDLQYVPGCSTTSASFM